MTRKTILSIGGAAILCVGFTFPAHSYPGLEAAQPAWTQPMPSQQIQPVQQIQNRQMQQMQPQRQMQQQPQDQMQQESQRQMQQQPQRQMQQQPQRQMQQRQMQQTQAQRPLQTQAAYMETNDVNGYAWMESSNDAKLNFLLGVESSMAVEGAATNARVANTSNKAEYSRFQQGWMTTFDKMSRQQIIDRVDAFYTANPNQKDRHVFDVIWSELIIPAQQVRR